MGELVADCPRCGSKKITFELTQDLLVRKAHGWQRWFEAFCVCRRCSTSTVFVLTQKSINDNRDAENGLVRCPRAVNKFMEIEGFISLKDLDTVSPPEHVPDDIARAFREGATCLKVECYNAAGAMFRLCLDLATKTLLPTEKEKPGPTTRDRNYLGLRLVWLFENGCLPMDLKDLSTCIKDDGNDGAHDGTLSKADGEDLLDFTMSVLERLYTQPGKLKKAQERRLARRERATE